MGGPWKVAGEALALAAWRPDFCPNTDEMTTAAFWARLPALPVEFWDEDTFLAAAVAGTPIAIDESTHPRIRARSSQASKQPSAWNVWGVPKYPHTSMASLLPMLILYLALSISFVLCSSHMFEPGTEETKLESVLQLQPNQSSLSTGIDPSKVIQLSWHPRAFLYKGFLSDDDCDYLISLAHGTVENSMLIDNDSGNGVVSNIRTKSGIFFTRGQDDVVSKIEERISAWTFLPKENGEEMQILHYGTNESYEPHFDYDIDQSKMDLGGHRIATVLMYLSNVTRGGETIFPRSESKDAQSKDSTWSDCAASGYAVTPVKGDALLFFNLHPDATPDESSLHGDCKVLEGGKWSATKWMHVRAFNTSKPSPLASDAYCTDEDDNCPYWAGIGECQRNAAYMLGSPDYYGSCRKSCGAC